MIALAKRLKQKLSHPAWHDAFEKMLPAIIRNAQFAFRSMPPEPREEAVAEVVAICWTSFRRLAERNKLHVASPTALARFAVAQYRDGRRAIGRQSPRDVMSTTAQRRKGFDIERLERFGGDERDWKDIIIEDRRAGPAETAACRLDFAAWLKLLPRRRRKIALALANGETTSAAAKKFGVTAARISQLRLWLKASWDAFQGEVEAAQASVRSYLTIEQVPV